MTNDEFCGCYTKARRTVTGGVQIEVDRCPVHTHALEIFAQLYKLRGMTTEIDVVLDKVEYQRHNPTLAT